MEAIDGVPVTDEMIQAWADEAERGYDVEVLRAHGRRPAGNDAVRIVPVVRMDEDLVAAVDRRAVRNGASRSVIIRSAVRAFVA